MRRGVVFGPGVDHACIRIAVAAVVRPQQFAVFGDAVGIIDVATEQEAQHIGRRGLDHGVELPRAEHVVADEVDPLHRRLLAFGDGKDQIDAVVAAIDDLGCDADVVASNMPIGFHDAADIGLHGGAPQAAARLGLDDRGKVSVLDLLIAFEGDAVQELRLGQMDDQSIAGAFDPDIVEQPGGVERLQRRIARGVIEPSVRRGVKVGAHGIGVAERRDE